VLPVSARAQEGQLGARIAIESDLRWRGYSLGAGDPVVSADLGYDGLAGFYLDGTALAQWRGDEPRYLGFRIAGGYARRIDDRWSVDAGAVRTDYRSGYPGGPSHRFTEVYAGVTRRPAWARLSFSPDYFGRSVQTLYLEGGSAVSLPLALRLGAQAGALFFVDQTPAPDRHRKAQYDWRIGLSRSFGSVEGHVNLSSGGPSRDYYNGAQHGRTALAVGASFSF
jgi:uncharacterized protein (TIGR02001 family)